MNTLRPRKLEILSIGVLSLFLIGCSTEQPNIPASALPPDQNQPGISAMTPDPLPAHEETITLTAAGDILMHNTQIWSGLKPDGTYDFDEFFTPVQYLIEEGDYASTTFEAPLAGPKAGYSGYPLFNSPDAMANTLKTSGFDLVNTAHNHALDQGYQGALRTIDILHQAGLDTTGTFKTPEDKTSVIEDIRGVRVGYLGYTYGTNGIPVPADHPEFINIINKEEILSDIETLRPQVDVLILVLHWGTEYSPQATLEQKELARLFLGSGADAILGSHPHVIEPMEIIEIDGKNKFVIYSMGNFISNQRGLERNSGIVLKLKYTKNFDSGETWLTEVSYTPTYSQVYQQDGRQKFRVIPVEQGIWSIKNGTDPLLSSTDLPVLEQVMRETTKLLGEPFYSENSSGNQAQ